MKTIPFSDRLNPVFVKELRQSFHDRSLAVAFAVLAVGQLGLWYIRSVSISNSPQIRDLFHFGYNGLLFVLLLLVIHLGNRSNKEIGKEGFDPALGTGYPPWKIVFGKTAAAWTILAGLLLIFLPGICLLGKTLPDRNLLAYLILLFLARQINQCLGQIPGARSARGLLALLFALWIIGAGFHLMRDLLEEEWSAILAMCGGGLLISSIFICGQIAGLMPKRADRSVPVKAAVLLTGAYFVLCSKLELFQTPGANTFTGLTAGFFILGSLFERKVPSQRQGEQAPRRLLFRIPAFLITTGCVPALFTGTVLAVITLLTAEKFLLSNLQSLLLSLFYVQLAVYLAEVDKLSAAVNWIVLLILLNVPIISGAVFPWGTALSLAAPEFIDVNLAAAIAGTAWLVSILLNKQLIARFLRLYFGRKEV